MRWDVTSGHGGCHLATRDKESHAKMRRKLIQHLLQPFSIETERNQDRRGHMKEGGGISPRSSSKIQREIKQTKPIKKKKKANGL